MQLRRAATYYWSETCAVLLPDCEDALADIVLPSAQEPLKLKVLRALITTSASVGYQLSISAICRNCHLCAFGGPLWATLLTNFTGN